MLTLSINLHQKDRVLHTLGTYAVRAYKQYEN